jgi:hypothetical protein
VIKQFEDIYYCPIYKVKMYQNDKTLEQHTESPLNNREFEDFRAYQDYRGGSFAEQRPNVVVIQPDPTEVTATAPVA